MQRYMGDLMGQIPVSWCFWTSVCFVSELRSLRSHHNCWSPCLYGRESWGSGGFGSGDVLVLHLSTGWDQVSLCVSCIPGRLPSGPCWCLGTLGDGRTAELEVSWTLCPPEQLFPFPKSCTLTPCSSSRMLSMDRSLGIFFLPHLLYMLLGGG